MVTYCCILSIKPRYNILWFALLCQESMECQNGVKMFTDKFIVTSFSLQKNISRAVQWICSLEKAYKTKRKNLPVRNFVIPQNKILLILVSFIYLYIELKKIVWGWSENCTTVHNTYKLFVFCWPTSNNS